MPGLIALTQGACLDRVKRLEIGTAWGDKVRKENRAIVRAALTSLLKAPRLAQGIGK